MVAEHALAGRIDEGEAAIEADGDNSGACGVEKFTQGLRDKGIQLEGVD
jgi:hypothetical protein